MNNIENYEKESFELDGKQVKPIPLKSDIPNIMKKRAYDLAIESMRKFSSEKDMSEYIKQNFDLEFLPCWQCVAGKDFSVSLSHESENFFFFQIENLWFLLFKI